MSEVYPIKNPPKLQQPKKLSYQQKQILAHIIAGQKNREMAVSMNIKIKTVEAHRYRMMKKLGVKTAGELVAKMYKGEVNV
jgi:DNA-binding CsgD family transcriptional regulator